MFSQARIQMNKQSIYNNSEYTLLKPYEVGDFFGNNWFEEESIQITVTKGDGSTETTYLIPTWRLFSLDKYLSKLDEHE